MLQDVIKINPIHKPAVDENSSSSDVFQIDVKSICVNQTQIYPYI